MFSCRSDAVHNIFPLAIRSRQSLLLSKRPRSADLNENLGAYTGRDLLERGKKQLRKRLSVLSQHLGHRRQDYPHAAHHGLERRLRESSLPAHANAASAPTTRLVNDCSLDRKELADTQRQDAFGSRTKQTYVAKYLLSGVEGARDLFTIAQSIVWLIYKILTDLYSLRQGPAPELPAWQAQHQPRHKSYQDRGR